jgi:uncharacterized membrane protein YfcA
MQFNEVWMTLAVFSVAILYSAIGQGGGSGYLAVMAAGGLSVNQMRPTALALNVLVSGLTGCKFVHAGRFQFRVFWPSVLFGTPAAMLGAKVEMHPDFYRILVAFVLLFACWKLNKSSRQTIHSCLNENQRQPIFVIAIAGGIIGFISGLTGIGGGIFLSPVIILCGWADARQAAGTSALFTLVNSMGGLTVMSHPLQNLPSQIVVWLPVTVLGALIGSEIGLKLLSELTMRRLLGMALAASALRSLWMIGSG